MLSTLAVASVGLLLAAPSVVMAGPISGRCAGSISSLDDVADAILCETITINAFTVPTGKALDLSELIDGAVVTLAGDVSWTGGTEWDGPMFLIGGSDVTFDGAGYTFDGDGSAYWDGLGSNGGVTKPQFLKVKNSGTFKNLNVANSPRQVFSVGSNPAALVIDTISIDNTAADAEGSDGVVLGHNSDCFDVSADDVTIQGSTCKNQDDCLALNSGSNFVFDSNTCSGGHGISIGSIKTGKVVKGVTISNNKVTSSTNGLRIKTYNGATDASVSSVVYSGNTLTGISDYGVVIEQDYENGSPTGSASDGVPITDVSFTGDTTSVTVTDDGEEVYVLCGSGTCTGTWDWSSLSVSGGSAGSISPSSVSSLITGFSI